MNEPLVRHRQRFPVLRERSYFTAQCLGPLTDETFVDVAEYTRTLTLRSRCLELWLGRMYELIQLIESFLNAPRGSVALRDSATASQAAIIGAVPPSPSRNRIVTSQQHHFKSSRYVWAAQARHGFSVVDVDDGGSWLSAEELCAAIDERTAFVALPLVSSRTGALFPLAEVVRHARRMGAISVVDAYQAVGIVPVDVQALDADVLVAGTHKWRCGGDMGLAFMYVRPDLAERLEPAYPGWIGHADLKTSAPTFESAPGALRFQQGSPAIAPIYTARAGLRFLSEVGVGAMRTRSLALTARLLSGAVERGFRVSTPAEAERRGGMLCFDMPAADKIAAALAAEGIDVDVRNDAGLRVGPFPCLEESECDLVIRRIAELAATIS